MLRRAYRRCTFAVVAGALLCPLARAAEHITLRNGFELDCLRQEATGQRIRLYLMPSSNSSTADASSYIEVAADAILRTESLPDPPVPMAPSAPSIPTEWVGSNPPKSPTASTRAAALTPAEMHEMLARAGTLHNIDADLLAAVVSAESGGQPRAVSRAGARGLMQLMPTTAATLGVRDSFAPEENIGGGAAYLDQLLTRYHDNIAFALAAYNAGPAAVDRYRGIPPFAETRAYVARVIREFNRRKLAAAKLKAIPALAAVATAAQ